jgi:eukaryotic-like serine/threonine-protein kinase
VFSPDGRSIAFWDFKQGQLQRIATEGGTPVRLAPVNLIYGASWAEGDVIWYAEENGIWKVEADGGAPAHVVKIEPGQRAHGPQLLPDGRSLLFTLLTRAQGVGSAAWDDAEIVVQSLDNGQRRSLTKGGDATYLPTGHLLFALNTVLFALPFDLSAQTVRGRPVPLVEGVQRATRTPGSSASANYAVSHSGALVYMPAVDDARAVPRSLVAVDRQGRSEPLFDEQRGYWRPRVSPDGKRVAVEVNDGRTEQIWIADLEKRAMNPLAADGGLNVFAAWTPDSQSIVFRSNRDGAHGVYRQQVDGASGAALVVRTPDEPIPTDISRDGVILFAQGSQSGARAIKTIQQGQVADFLATPAMEHMAVFSPDGKWVAYVSNESGRDEVYLRPFPRGDGRSRRISSDGATAPVWARDGSELYFRGGSGDLMAVPITHTPAITVGRPQSLFRVTNRFRISGNAAAYDVHPDGKRFVMVTEPATPTAGPRQIIVVSNFLDELRAKVR